MKRPLREKMDPLVAEKLQAAGRRWQWLFFWRLLSGLVIFFALALLALGLLIRHGWISNSLVAVLFCVLLVLLFGLGLMAIAVLVALRRKPNSWLAGEIERRLPTLMDRVNTLTYLEARPADRMSNAFFRGIGLQAGNELARQPQARPISAKLTVLVALAALATVAGTWEFFQQARPWEAFSHEGILANASESAVEFALPEEGASEVRQAWGEVRITEPGGDLKLTKVDVLPLTVEAASSQQLQHASWSTAINGGAATEHDLPAPEEPNYAVYQPSLYLDELGLADWDVLSYFARASTEGDGNYASEIYFVEIRPFREDILKLEGGGGGGKKQCLDKLGGLIQKEQDILRQTYRQMQKPSRTTEQRKQDQEKLGAAQSELGQATAHLYAEVAARENENVGTVLDQLALAQGSMEEAAGELGRPDNPAALAREQLALQQLIEARKDLIKQISEGGGNGSGSAESPPVAGMKEPSGDQLADIADFRNEGKAAVKAVQAVREKEEAIAKEAVGADSQKRVELAHRQQAAARELSELQEKVPAPFKGLEEETAAAEQAMEKAAGSMTQQTAAPAAQQAVEALAHLEQQMAGQMARRSLGDVYRMKSLLDDQADGLGGMEKDPQSFSAKDFEAAAVQAKSIKDAMAQALEETPAGQAFGPGLSKALGGVPGQQLDQAAAQMKEAGGNSEVAGQGAGQARVSLAEIAKAFDASQPAMLRGAAEAGAGENSGNGIGEAVRKINSLIQRMTEGRKTSDEDLRKQLEEARLMLLEESKAHADEVPQLLAVAENLAAMREEVDLQVDPEALRKLVDRLETVRLEIADHQQTAPVDPKLRHADPTGAPAEFRERVRRYFEKLSDG